MAAETNFEQAPTDAFEGAQATVTEAEDAFERAIADVNAPAPDTYAPEPEILRGERQVVELAELACKQYGTNCEFARLATRQYREKYRR